MSTIAQLARVSARQMYKQAGGAKKGLGRVQKLLQPDVPKPKVKPKPKPKVKAPTSKPEATDLPLETAPRGELPAGHVDTPGTPTEFGVDPSTQPGYRYPDVDEMFPRDQRTQFGGDEVAPAGQQDYLDFFHKDDPEGWGPAGLMQQTGAADHIPPLIRRPKYKAINDEYSILRQLLKEQGVPVPKQGRPPKK